ncbi:MAG: 6-hydroxymethylpterin diphosphokinase MptE-like protein [Candidatus Delongbacteria bacterium]
MKLAWSEAARRCGAQPAYPLEAAPDGDWSFRLPDGRLGCSARAPLREARLRVADLLDSPSVLLLGLGAGHELDLLLRDGSGQILVVEADLRSLATTLERWRRLGRDLPADSRCSLLLAPSDGELCAGLAALLENEHAERPVLVRAACADLWRTGTPGAAGLVEDLLCRRASARAQEELLRENAGLNHARLLQAADVAEQRGGWGADPVVVLGAGPSLGDDLQRLAECRAEGVRLLAVNTALPVLEGRGLLPDAAVATDPSPLLGADLPRGAAWSHVPLAVFPGTCPALVRGWPGPLWLALPEGPGLFEQEWHGRRPGTLRAGCGTVAGPALALAAWLSAGPLLLSGVDLAADGRGHVAGVRRPADTPRPDFGFARRRMGEWVRELRRAGRQVRGLSHAPDWLPREENE